MAPQSQSYPLFSGRARHALDPKNRTTIPSDWRPENPTPLWLSLDADQKCLLAMPYEEFCAVPETINALENVSPQDKQDFVALFYSEAQKVTPDSQGRFVIPQHFCEQLNLKEWVSFAGANSRFQIWNSDEYERFRTERLKQVRSIGKQAQL